MAIAIRGTAQEVFYRSEDRYRAHLEASQLDPPQGSPLDHTIDVFIEIVDLDCKPFYACLKLFVQFFGLSLELAPIRG